MSIYKTAYIFVCSFGENYSFRKQILYDLDELTSFPLTLKPRNVYKIQHFSQ